MVHDVPKGTSPLMSIRNFSVGAIIFFCAASLCFSEGNSTPHIASPKPERDEKDRTEAWGSLRGLGSVLQSWLKSTYGE